MLKLCFSLIITFAVIGEGYACPKHWLRFGDFCFKIIESENTWAGSNIVCEQMGGYLAEIDSEMKAVLIKVIVKDSHSHSPFVWLGGNDLLLEGDWVWTKSNLPFNYTDWCHGQPNDKDNEDCMAMGSSTLANCDEKWFDEKCERRCSSLCEMKAPSMTVVG